jgi:hypothetical protein
MAEFDIEVRGVPFTVSGVDSEQQAQSRVMEAIQAKPSIVRDKAIGLGMMFDEETQQARPRSTLNKFLIGVGKSVQDTIDMVHTAFLEQDGQDFQELMELDARMARDQEIFDRLASEEGSTGTKNQLAADAGEIVGTGIQVFAPALQGTRALIGMAKFISPFAWARTLAGKRFMQTASKEKLTGQEVAQALSTPKGQNIGRQMSAAEKPTAKVVDGWVKGLREANPPGANAGVRQAQLELAKSFRENALPQPGGASAARNLANQQARNAFSRIEVKSTRATATKQLREAIRKANTGN